MSVVRQAHQPWKECKLGEVIFSNVSSITASYPYKTIKYLDTGSITCGKIDSFQEIPLNEAPSRAKRLVKDGSIVYSTVRPIQRHYGYIKNPPENLVVSTGFSVIETQPDLADSLFIYNLLASKDVVELLDTIAEGSTSAYPSLKPTDIENLDILLPPLPEQKTIAGVLSSLDDKIDLMYRQNRTLEAMAEALCRQWFVEPCKYGLPEGCEEVPLSAFADNIRENAKVEDLSKHEYYVGLEHIPRKKVILDSWGVTGSLESNKSIFKQHDILFGKLRSYFHKVVCTPISGVCSTDILVIRPKKESWLPFCLFWFFNEDVVEHSDLGSGGTRMPRTNWEIVGGYKVPRPTENRIIEFDMIVRPFLNKMFMNIENIRILENLRDTLLPKLMNGEVRI
jgi:type I restriction enzyme S subunit